MHHHHVVAADHSAILQGFSQNVVYLMGLSFVVGSLFTILILIVLDVMRRNSETAPKRRKK